MCATRIAALNVENLFDRPKAMAGLMTGEGNPILAAHARVNSLFGEETYTETVRASILEQLEILGLLASDTASQAVLLQVRGNLLARTRKTATKPARVEVVADGRASWIGWVDLVREPVDELAMDHTAQVFEDVNADIFGVVEAENRIVLKRFADSAIVDAGDEPLYPHIMVIDGNDNRGIDVGIMIKKGYRIETMRSHIDDRDDSGRRIFGRDCPEYAVTLPNGKRIVVLVNHFKSKGYGSQTSNNATRRRQATRVAAIYDELLARGETFVAVLGDLNDTPGSAPLKPLLKDTTLKDIADHPQFTSDGRKGTYANGTASQKIDYVLLSPALFERVTGGAIFRMGVWGGKQGTLFPHYETMTSPAHAASDHAAIYADIDLD
ncbi:MAG TPA: endonuclease/exonuclease/phosphatase family protein [Thermomicrobiales bacterium]|nr:endonuclease/exonuclease/phosphatase family protein [Thermomicrobiales bacterium]